MLLMLDAKIDASHAGSLKSVIRALLLRSIRVVLPYFVLAS